MLAPLGILMVTAAVSVWTHWRGTAPYNSDQAIVALMAQDILYRGAHPVLFDGSTYAGTLEQHYLAVWFWLLPDTVTVHRAAIGVLLLGIVLATWALARSLFGPRVALASGLYLALGPHFFYYRGLMSDGPYTPFYLLSALTLCLIVVAQRRAVAGAAVVAPIIAIAFLLGLAWWTHPLAMALGLAVAAAFASGSLRRRLSWKASAAALAAFLVGGLPWWLHNASQGWTSLSSGDAALRPLERVPAQLAVLAREGLPILLGTRALRDLSPTSWASAMAGIGLGLAILVTGSLLVYRFGAAPARKLLTLALLLAAASAGMGVLSFRVDFSEPRFLFPAYFALALCFGVLVTSAKIAAPVRASLIAAVLVLHVRNHLGATTGAAPSDAGVRQIERAGVSALYTTYWKAFPITMRSGGRVIAAPFGVGEYTRGRRERAEVDAAASPGLLYEGATAARLARFLDRGGWRHRVLELPEGTLFYDLAPEALAQLRACGCIPPPLD